MEGEDRESSSTFHLQLHSFGLYCLPFLDHFKGGSWALAYLFSYPATMIPRRQRHATVTFTAVCIERRSLTAVAIDIKRSTKTTDISLNDSAFDFTFRVKRCERWSPLSYKCSRDLLSWRLFLAIRVVRD